MIEIREQLVSVMRFKCQSCPIYETSRGFYWRKFVLKVCKLFGEKKYEHDW